MAFFKFTFTETLTYPAYSITANPGKVFDFGSSSPPADGYWVSDPGPATAVPDNPSIVFPPGQPITYAGPTAQPWTAVRFYPAGSVVLHPSGQRTIVRTAAGTSRSSYDATEAALWADSAATYYATAGLASGDATGATDLAVIQALLTAARTAGGGVVKGLPGQNYIISAPWIIGSGTTLDMRGCTITVVGGAGGSNLLNNYARTAARTVMDAVTTASSTTLTSATAAFVSGDVGATVWVWGGGAQGDIHRTTIASVTNGTTVVLAAAVTTALSAATVSIGPRDSRITVIGGVWDRGTTPEGTGNNAHNLLFRRADQITIRDIKVKSTTAKYAVFFSDCTEFLVDNITFDTYADGVHITGPCERGVVRGARGYTRDDTVSITPNDWTPYNDTWGDISDIYIEDIRPYKSDNTCVKVLGGSAGARVLTARAIRIRNVGGLATNVDQTQGGLVWVGDDPGQATTTGGRIEDVTVENVAGRCRSGEELILINGANIGRVTLRNLRAEPSAESAALSLVGTVWVKTGASVEHLTVDGLSMRASVLHTSGHVAIDSGATVSSLAVRNVQMVGGSANHLVAVSGTVTRLAVTDVAGVGSCANTWLVIIVPSGVVTDMMMDRIQIGSGSGWKSPVRADALCTLTTLTFTNVELHSSQFTIGELGVTTNVFASDVKSDTYAYWASTAASTVTMHASNCEFGNDQIGVTAGYHLSSKTFGFVTDVSQLTTKVVGDAATNSSNANTGTLGVGPVVCISAGAAPNWKSLVSGNTW